MVCAARGTGATSRLREIDRALVALRREQRLFRRLGFGENIKVMQIVTLQMERQECIEALGPAGRGYRSNDGGDRALAIAKGLARGLMLVCGLLYCVARGLAGERGQRRPRRRIARPVADSTMSSARLDRARVRMANSSGVSL